MPRPKARVLQVIGGLDRAGAEVWLTEVFRHASSLGVAFDFVVHDSRPYALTRAVERLGARVIVNRTSDGPLSYVRRLISLLSTGDYVAVHSHCYLYSGLAMLASALAGVANRITHAHTGRLPERQFPRWLYEAGMVSLIHAHSTAGVAVSDAAGRSVFRQLWGSDPRFRLLYCGIDLAPFERPEGLAQRPSGSTCLRIGHVGRFTEPKNHAFLLEVFRELLRLRPDSKLHLVGDGPLRGEIEEEIRAHGLAASVVLHGVREDVPQILMSGIDAIVFPSLWEGLPLSVVEAQASELPCFISDAITPEVIVDGELVMPLPLSAGARAWAKAIAARFAPGRSVRSTSARQLLVGSRFDIRTSVRKLLQLYGIDTVEVGGEQRRTEESCPRNDEW